MKSKCIECEANNAYPRLRWEPAMYSRGTVMLADYNYDINPDLYVAGMHHRYVVRRAKPHSRDWVARRDGEPFTRRAYKSQEDAQAACEKDAISPSSVLNLKGMADKLDVQEDERVRLENIR